MIELTMDAESISNLLQQLSKPSTLDWLQFIVGAATIIVLIKTLLLQTKTANLLMLDNKFRLMPYFDIFIDPKRDELNQHFIRANKALAFNIRFENIGEANLLEDKDFTDIHIDIIADKELVNVLKLKFLDKELVEAMSEKNEKTAFLKILFSDYEGRRYSQQFYLKNRIIHVTKPIVEYPKKIYLDTIKNKVLRILGRQP